MEIPNDKTEKDLKSYLAYIPPQAHISSTLLTDDYLASTCTFPLKA